MSIMRKPTWHLRGLAISNIPIIRAFTWWEFPTCTTKSINALNVTHKINYPLVVTSPGCGTYNKCPKRDIKIKAPGATYDANKANFLGGSDKLQNPLAATKAALGGSALPSHAPYISYTSPIPSWSTRVGLGLWEVSVSMGHSPR